MDRIDKSCDLDHVTKYLGHGTVNWCHSTSKLVFVYFLYSLLNVVIGYLRVERA